MKDGLSQEILLLYRYALKDYFLVQRSAFNGDIVVDIGDEIVKEDSIRLLPCRV